MEEESAITWVGVAVLAGIVTAIVALIALRPGDQAEARTGLERVRRQGSVRIGFANEAPYGYLDTDTGRVTGEAPEIARVVFARMGITDIEAVSTDFGSLIPGLKAGRFDVIAAGMYVTPERCRQIAFTNPTYRIGEALIVTRGNPAELHGFDDIVENADTRLGVVAGAIELTYARRLGIPDDQLVLYGDNVSALEGVRTGRIAAFACTTLTALNLLQRANDDRLELAQPMRQPIIDGLEQVGYGAFGIRKTDDELRRAINTELSQFIGSAEHLDLVRPFGFGNATVPTDVTARDLCGEVG